MVVKRKRAVSEKMATERPLWQRQLEELQRRRVANSVPLPHHTHVVSQQSQHESAARVHVTTTPMTPQQEWTTTRVNGSVHTKRPTTSDSQQGQSSTPIQIDDDEEKLLAPDISMSMFATTAEFMVAYAGSHTLRLEAQHRRYRFLNIAPHGDICIVCSRKKDMYINRFDCCSLKFCADCATYGDGKPVLETDRFCPLCFKRGWNHMRPYFGSKSPVWKLLPTGYKERYIELSHRVLETIMRLVPEWRDWHKLQDDGSLASDRLILHALRPYSISQYGKEQLAAFAAEHLAQNDVITTSGLPKQGGPANGDAAQEPDLQWFVSRPMLPLVRFDKTIAAHEEYISLHQTSSTLEASQALALRRSEDITIKEGSSNRQTDQNSGVGSTIEQASGSMPRITSRTTTSEEQIQIQELKNTVDWQRGRISRLKRTLDSRTDDLNAQKKICMQDHVPDLAAFGMELARARGIARGNAKGVETRLQGDYLSKLPVQRLLDNPIFDRNWVQPPKKRKQAESGAGWVVEDVAIKIEDDD